MSYAKRCTDCGDVKDSEKDFYKAAGYRDGIMSRCKSCHLTRSKTNAKQNRDKVNARRRARAADRDNPAVVAERDKRNQWLRAHPQQRMAAKRRHRARKYGSGGRHTEAEWAALCELTGHRCARCKEKKPLSRDHIVPLSRGGSDDITNIQPLCRECNSKKCNREAINYLTGEEHASILAMPATERKRRSIAPAVATYLLRSPDGVEIVTTKGLNVACQELGLLPNGMRQVLCGTRKQHRGWTIVCLATRWPARRKAN
jgi:5-methylcytosine-specific restriction endonuclease McrA